MMEIQIDDVFKGTQHSWPKISMFVLYFKIINTFLKNNVFILKKKSKELENDIGILVDQEVFKLSIKTVKILFWSITQEPLDLLKF